MFSTIKSRNIHVHRALKNNLEEIFSFSKKPFTVQMPPKERVATFLLSLSDELLNLMMRHVSVYDLYVLWHTCGRLRPLADRRIKQASLSDEGHSAMMTCVHGLNVGKPWDYVCGKATCRTAYATIKTARARTKYFLEKKHFAMLRTAIVWEGSGYTRGYRELRSPVKHYLLVDVKSLSEKTKIDVQQKQQNRAKSFDKALTKAGLKAADYAQERAEHVANHKKTTLKERVARCVAACTAAKHLEELYDNLPLHLYALSDTFACVELAAKGEINEVRMLARLERQHTLCAALAALKLELRSDSRLCEQYILGDNTLAPGVIANEMAIMKWLYQHTNYNRRVQQEAEAEFARYEMFRDERPSAHEIYADARAHVKALYLKRNKPTTWPWL